MIFVILLVILLFFVILCEANGGKPNKSPSKPFHRCKSPIEVYSNKLDCELSQLTKGERTIDIKHMDRLASYEAQSCITLPIPLSFRKKILSTKKETMDFTQFIAW